MYNVGQIVYGFLDSKQAIFPLQIVEEVTIKNLDGVKTTYKVLLPNSKQQKVVLSNFSRVFIDINEASNYLIENAKKAIEELTFEALELEEKFFKTKLEKDLEEEKPKEIDEACNNENKKVKIDLGDGTSASINVDQIEKLSS